MADAKKQYTSTYRVSRIPSIFQSEDIRGLFDEADQELIRGPLSLANSVYMTELCEKVATVTFSKQPKFAISLGLTAPNICCQLKTPVKGCYHDIQVDNHFEGLTPLNDPGLQDVTVDIVACSGLAAGAFIGWQHESGTMWLRDLLPVDLPGCRIFIWGKRSQLHRSQSHVGIHHYRDSLLDDLGKIRQSPAERRRPLILLGHSLGGIVMKAAFVKASQDKAYSAIRDTMSGLVFFGTPHEGIHNEDWVDVWGDEPPNTLIRDLSPGSSLLRDLRESFEQHSREEKFFTVYELQETRTVQKIAGGKLDRNGEPVLRIDEKAACINSANETRMGVNEDHSKIAKLHNGDGSPYHFIKTHIQEVADHARIITTTRMRRKFILCVLLGLRAYFTHVFRSVSSPSVLLLAEYSDINAICDILEEPNILEEPDNSLLHLALPTASVRIASQAAENLKSLFYNNITEASFLHGTLRKRLNNDTGSFWLAAEEQTNHGLAIPPVCTEDLVNAAVPLIIELKESIATALPLQNKSLLKAFIESEQAKHLGLHLVVRRRELWNQLGIPAIPPTDGILTDVLQQKGLSIGTFYANDGPEAHLVIVERRSYKTLGAGMPSQKERKAVSKELAAILRDASFSSLENKSMRRLLSPVMSIFEFEGYIDDLESKEHIFMYRVPTQPGISSREMISRSMSLDFWIGDTGDGPPRLEERYAVAYHLCHTVFNQHVSGWVHKSLRPANVILIPNSTRDSEFLQIGRGYTQKPYLKGFELSRKVATPSLRIPEVDSDADVYVHPDRRGKRIITEFHPVHDMYALGVLLIEIGTGLPILESIRQLKCPSASRIYEDDTKRVAKEKLPGNLGTRYAECAIRCLEGYHGFQVHHRYRDNTDLITAFRMLVVDELKRMAVAGGYSFEG